MKLFVVIGVLALLAVGQAQDEGAETTTVDPTEDDGETSSPPPPPPPPSKRPGPPGPPGHHRSHGPPEHHRPHGPPEHQGPHGPLVNRIPGPPGRPFRPEHGETGSFGGPGHRVQGLFEELRNRPAQGSRPGPFGSRYENERPSERRHFPRRLPVLFDFGSGNDFGVGNIFGRIDGKLPTTTTTTTADPGY
uniref:Mitochondrial fission regulator n=1 Tax=Musca domestica TaxID=7370 RepID=T1PN38_MUSDO